MVAATAAVAAVANISNPKRFVRCLQKQPRQRSARNARRVDRAPTLQWLGQRGAKRTSAHILAAMLPSRQGRPSARHMLPLLRELHRHPPRRSRLMLPKPQHQPKACTRRTRLQTHRATVQIRLRMQLLLQQQQQCHRYQRSQQQPQQQQQRNRQQHPPRVQSQLETK